MKEFWNAIQFVFTAVGGWLGYFLGECDGLLYALLAFVVIDYITGAMCAISGLYQVKSVFEKFAGRYSFSYW